MLSLEVIEEKALVLSQLGSENARLPDLDELSVPFSDVFSSGKPQCYLREPGPHPSPRMLVSLSRSANSQAHRQEPAPRINPLPLLPPQLVPLQPSPLPGKQKKTKEKSSYTTGLSGESLEKRRLERPNIDKLN